MVKNLKTRLCIRVIAWVFALSALTVDAAVVVTTLAEPLLLYDPTNPVPTYAPIDINQDGVVDFTFGYGFTDISLKTERSNRAVIHNDAPPDLGGSIEALLAGYMIGPTLEPGDSWISADLRDGYVSPGESAFINIVEGFNLMYSSRMPAVLARVYMGLEFELADGTHYGYFDLEAQHDTLGVRIHGWAWESQPNTPILAGSVPEPGRIVLLLAGVFALVCRRRRVTAAG